MEVYKMINKITLILLFITILKDKTTEGIKRQRRVKTTKCKYTFIVNEMDTSNCPSALQQLQADREPEKSVRVNPLLPQDVPLGENPKEVKKWLNTLESKFYEELKRSDEINTTLSKHEVSLKHAEKLLTEYQSNFTAIFRMLRFLENSIQDQSMTSKHLDKKLSGILLDVMEVNNVLSKKAVSIDGQVQDKNIEVQSVSKITSCTKSPEAVVYRGKHMNIFY